MNSAINRQFRLKYRPEHRVTRDHFDFVEEPLPQPGPGQALLRNLYLSLDPTNRIWMSDMEQYMPPVQLGDVMRGSGIAQVIASQDPHYQVGDLVMGLIGWQDYTMTDQALRYAPLPKGLPLDLPTVLGVLGPTGLTAYFGLLEVGQPKSGETVVISAAAGAVGSIVGQIAQLKGCRAVGITGSSEKCAWLTGELGFAAAVNHRDLGWKDQLKQACPNGVDINFENVGGEILDTVSSLLKLRARIVLCGLISAYNNGHSMASRADLVPILMKRARIEGFIVLDFAERFAEAQAELGQWLIAGKLKHRETIVEGLEHVPEAFNKLFDGDKIGKLMVKIADPQ
ncbi:NADP-dependent oxidoreductase [Anthocerotibacter panamensis]|uniref:NADP-dependent oxidoreductase n=1 Tax=Anthocerotibacter panamensis TaxID=2857077 RepID=UPI001C408155|nr:NADP-dependent oxidoreductase [Anthocerotibacter panamensis]